MKSKQSGSKSMDLYTRHTLLIFSSLFVFLTLTFVTISSLGNSDTSTWIGKIQQFFLNLYPNIFIIPFAVLISSVFLRPMSKAAQDEQEEQFLERMRITFLPALEEKILENMKELLVPMVETTLTHALQGSASLQASGIIAMKPRINYEEMHERIVQSKKRVYFSDTGILYHNLNELADAFRQTADDQVLVRILLLDPQSSVAKQRAIDIYQDQSDHLSKASMAIVTAFHKTNPLENLELRFHTSMPAMQIFICDDKATVGFYFHGKDSQTLPQLEVLIKDDQGKDTPFGKQIEAEFEKRWNLATPGPL